VNPFAGEFFEHGEWVIRRGMERHSSLRPFYQYEAHYTNAAGYWMIFSVAALTLREEAIRTEGTQGIEDTTRYDVWEMLAMRYGLRMVGLRTEFYKKFANDPMHAKMVTLVLEGQTEIPAKDDLNEVMEKLGTHMGTQLMKVAASLHANNAVKRSGDEGAASK
jgi:hypothetical protein